MYVLRGGGGGGGEEGVLRSTCSPSSLATDQATASDVYVITLTQNCTNLNDGKSHLFGPCCHDSGYWFPTGCF